jgi:hypothetical protein
MEEKVEKEWREEFERLVEIEFNKIKKEINDKYKSYKSSGEKNHVLVNENIRKECMKTFDSSMHSISDSLAKYVKNAFEKIVKFIEENKVVSDIPNPSFDHKEMKGSVDRVIGIVNENDDDVTTLKVCILKTQRGKKDRLNIPFRLECISRSLSKYLDRSLSSAEKRIDNPTYHKFIEMNEKRVNHFKNLDLKFPEAKNIDEVHEEIQADFNFFKTIMIYLFKRKASLYYFLRITIDIFVEEQYDLAPVFKKDFFLYHPKDFYSGFLFLTPKKC